MVLKKLDLRYTLIGAGSLKVSIFKTMEQSIIIGVLEIVAFFSIVLGLLLLAYEDGVPFGLIKRIRCKFGWHKRYKKKAPRYYCGFCKEPKKHPELKVIDGGNKMGHSGFKF